MAELPNEGVTANGLTVMGYDDILTFAKDTLNELYAQDGEQINFGSETPDGQFTNILAQLGADVRELSQGVYNSFNPDMCSGIVQDQRYALNYLFRNGGTFTIQNIDVTVNQTVTLQGLDGNYNDLNAASYTVADNNGNLWYLIDTTELTSGTTSLPFRSQNYGSYQSTIGTITNQVTKVLGVTSVINSVAPTTLGTTQETDSAFRIRRNRSTAIKGQNNNDAMLAQLLELDGVSDADLWVNNDDETDDTGTPAHKIWVIVDGGANSDIAAIVYQNSSGQQMRGNVSVDVPAISGQIFEVNFDRPTPVPLYIQFDFKLMTELSAVNISGIKQYIADNLTYDLNEDAETSKITTVASSAILANGGGGYALNVEVSTDGTTWTDYIASSSRANKFVTDTTRITVNAIEME